MKFKIVTCGTCDHCVCGDRRDCYNAYMVEVPKKPRAVKAKKKDDADWRREMAMEAGMGLGLEAYNDAMGW